MIDSGRESIIFGAIICFWESGQRQKLDKDDQGFPDFQESKTALMIIS